MVRSGSDHVSTGSEPIQNQFVATQNMNLMLAQKSVITKIIRIHPLYSMDIYKLISAHVMEINQKVIKTLHITQKCALVVKSLYGTHFTLHSLYLNTCLKEKYTMCTHIEM